MQIPVDEKLTSGNDTPHHFMSEPNSPPTKPNKASTSITISEEILNAVKAEADKQKRTVSQQIEFWIDQQLSPEQEQEELAA